MNAEEVSAEVERSCQGNVEDVQILARTIA